MWSVHPRALLHNRGKYVSGLLDGDLFDMELFDLLDVSSRPVRRGAGLGVLNMSSGILLHSRRKRVSHLHQRELLAWERLCMFSMPSRPVLGRTGFNMLSM